VKAKAKDFLGGKEINQKNLTKFEVRIQSTKILVANHTVRLTVKPNSSQRG
jgi:hypothetical protein